MHLTVGLGLMTVLTMPDDDNENGTICATKKKAEAPPHTVQNYAMRTWIRS